MAYLVASLRALFNEIDTVWPNRDHRTDGWIGDKKHCPGVSDHCADSAGRVHAIDIDKDGINPGLVIGRLIQYRDVIRYINHAKYQYHKKNDFEPKKLTGDPHLGWIHVSIEHTDTARGYVGGYGILPGSGTGEIVIPDLQLQPQSNWDHSPFVGSLGDVFAGVGNTMQSYADLTSSLRI